MIRRAIPFDTGPIHFVGICGVGLSGFAEVLFTLGYEVQGWDAKASKFTDGLVSLGARFFEGQKAENIGDGVSVAGNMLAGPRVVEDTLEAYQDNPGLPLVERLLVAMDAGERAGGDKRGRQSAALTIGHGEAYPWLDIRTDDHADPLAELRRLYAVAQERYLLFAKTMPTAANVSGLLDRSGIDREIVAREAALAARGEASASFASPPVAPEG